MTINRTPQTSEPAPVGSACMTQERASLKNRTWSSVGYTYMENNLARSLDANWVARRRIAPWNTSMSLNSMASWRQTTAMEEASLLFRLRSRTLNKASRSSFFRSRVCSHSREDPSWPVPLTVDDKADDLKLGDTVADMNGSARLRVRKSTGIAELEHRIKAGPYVLEVVTALRRDGPGRTRSHGSHVWYCSKPQCAGQYPRGWAGPLGKQSRRPGTF